MTKMFGALFLAASMAYAGAASANTVVYYAEASDVDELLAFNTTRTFSIAYDSSLWASITSAVLTVFLGDDRADQTENADLAAIEGMDPGVDEVKVTGAETKEYWLPGIDVSGKLLPPHSPPLTFTLKAVQGDFEYRNAKLTVNFTPIPEASTTALLGSGLLVACLALRRRVS